jgi:periplasmic protein TonB
MSSSMRGMTGGDWWSVPPSRRNRDLVAAAIAVAAHAAIAAALLIVNPSRLTHHEVVVEMEVQEKPLPPPEIRTERPPPPVEPEAAPRPRVVPRRMASAAPQPPPSAPAPPPPNQEPPKPTDAPPVFGVTISSVVSGDSAGLAVPVGNTLMTKERKPGKTGAVPQAYAAEGTRPFTPVADIYIAQQAKVIFEVNSADIYPTEAYKMGIEGTVTLKVDIDENGEVLRVKVVGKAGHGFDEAARDALRRFKFSPARGSDGKPVPVSIPYRFTFDMPH